MNDALTRLAESNAALAAQFAAGWDRPAAEWSAEQWAAPDRPHFEPAFRRALVAELARAPDADGLVTAVEATGAVLTPQHVCPTNGPTFGAIDRIATFGQPGPVLVLAWSGVPMSNAAASGALCFSAAAYEDLLTPGPEQKRQRQAAKDRERDGVTERRIVLVPPPLRDALLYRCPVPDRTREALSAASDRLRDQIAPLQPEDDYASWALRTCETIERRLVGRDNLWYVDVNRVAARYLLEVLEDDGHPVTRMLGADPSSLSPALEGMSWFYARRPGKTERVATLTATPENLAQGLADGSLCPGLVPVFGALRLCSRMVLLGGFRQVTYLERIAQAWLEAGWVSEDRGVPGRLMTGRLTTPEGTAIHPLDVAVGAVAPDTLPGPTTPMSTFWAPLLPRVAHR